MGCPLTGSAGAVGDAPHSLWRDTAGQEPPARPALPGDVDADVVIVGGGFSGLWTAYYLAGADPALRVVLLEAQTVGFGASGRNGGWCSALFPKSMAGLAGLSDRGRALALHRAMRDTVDEVGRVVEQESIDCHFAKGGTVALARSRAQLARAEDEVRAARSWGRDADEIALLDAGQARRHLRAVRVLGATYTPDCAAIQPLRLARGLADAVQRRGVAIHEHTPATTIEPGLVRTPYGTAEAPVVVRATEGYTPRLPGHARAVAPLYSLMIATEPLPASVWEQIGLDRRETFTDYRHLLIYGQRTADDRIAFGGRGAPYHFGSKVRPEFDRDPAVFAALRRTLVELLPVLRDARITHSWGGPLGVPRDWCASVGLEDGIGWAGGYVGDGVGTTNLAGRTLADLVLGRDTPLVRLPWVGHRSRSWEPEPLRWLGINAGLRLMAVADAEERWTGRPSRLARAAAPLLGGH